VRRTGLTPRSRTTSTGLPDIGPSGGTWPTSCSVTQSDALPPVACASLVHSWGRLQHFRWLLEPTLPAAGCEILDVTFRDFPYGISTCVNG
jgi:hypothetical protein